MTTASDRTLRIIALGVIVLGLSLLAPPTAAWAVPECDVIYSDCMWTREQSGLDQEACCSQRYECVARHGPSILLTDDAEHAVYAAVLSEQPERYMIQAIILNETANTSHDERDTNFDFDHWTGQHFRKELLKREPPVSLTSEVESYRDVRSSVVRLNRDKLGLPKARLVAFAEIDAFLGSGGWAKFREHFGAKRLVRLSRVGFNRDRSRAVVSLAEHCGGLCGTGWLYALEKQSGKWRVLGRMATWVS